MHPQRQCVKREFPAVLTFVLIFSIHSCSTEETTNSPSDLLERPTDHPTLTPADKRSDEGGIDRRILGDDINISLELPNDDRQEISRSSRETTQAPITDTHAQESGPKYTFWKYNPADKFKHGSSLISSPSSHKERGAYPDDFYGPNPAQNGYGKKPEKATPASDRSYGKFGAVWKKRPIIPLITRQTTILSPRHSHHHGWRRPRRRPHRRPHRHHGRTKRYRHAHRRPRHRHHRHRHHSPHHHHHHSNHIHHDHGYGHGDGHAEHGYSDGPGWESHHAEHTHSAMPSYAPAYISYGPFYKLPPGVKLENPVYVAPANAPPAYSHSNSHSKYPGLHHMDTPHMESHGPPSKPSYHHSTKYSHQVEHFDDHNSLEDYGPSYDSREGHYSHSHDKPYRHKGYGREIDHPHHHPHESSEHHHDDHLTSREVSHSPHYGHDSYAPSESPPTNYFNIENSHLGQSSKHVGTNVPGYGTPDAMKNYEAPMNFGHPMHNFGPPMSSFGQPSPTFGESSPFDDSQGLRGVRDSYLPSSDFLGKPNPIYGLPSGTNGHQQPLDNKGFGSPSNFFDKDFKHLMDSTNNNFVDPIKNPGRVGVPLLKKTIPHRNSNYRDRGNHFFNRFNKNKISNHNNSPLPPLIAYNDNNDNNDNDQSFTQKHQNFPPADFRPSKLIEPFPMPSNTNNNGIVPSQGRPPPNYDTNYNSPGLSHDPKKTDWFHFTKRRPGEKILMGYPLAEKRKNMKFSTLPEPFKPFHPDPRHRNIPKITYDNMGKIIEPPRRRLGKRMRSRHRELLTKETKDVPISMKDVQDELRELQEENDSLTQKSEQGFKDMIKAHKILAS